MQTTKYETIVVFNPELGEAKIREEQKRVEGLIKNEGGDKIAVDDWGKKELPFLVKKQRYGYFVCINFESSKASTVAGVTSTLRITDSVLRFQTHRINERPRKFQGNRKRRVTAGADEFGGLEADY